MGFNHPFGYDYSDGVLVINSAEGEVVKKIFSDYLLGKSMGEIARSLNRARVDSKRGGKWDKKTISNILKNPLYYGSVAWDGIIRAAPHEALIDEDVFEKVQDIIARRRAKLPVKMTR